MKFTWLLWFLFSPLLLGAGSGPDDQRKDFAAAVVKLTSSMVEEALAKELQTAMALPGQIQMMLTRPWNQEIMVSPDWKIELLDTPRQLASQMVLRCRLLSSGRTVNTWYLPCTVEWLQPAWVTRRSLDREQALTLDYLQIWPVDMLKNRHLVSTDFDLSDLAAARLLPAGTPLTWRDVTARTLVKRGAMVEVLVRQGTLLISMKAEALQSGIKGQRINCRNLQSLKNFTVVVIGENQAEVVL